MTETNETPVALPYVYVSDGESIDSPGIDVLIDEEGGDIRTVSTFEFEDAGYNEVSTQVCVDRNEFKSGYDVEVEGEELIGILAGSGVGREGPPDDKWHEFAAAIYLDEDGARALRNQLDHLLGNTSADPDPDWSTDDPERASKGLLSEQ